MWILVTGLVVFLGVHLLPRAGALRSALRHRLGEAAYMAAFSLISLAGLLLIVWGKASADVVPLYDPPAWGRHLALTLVFVAFVLMAAYRLNGYIRAILHHPFLIAVMVWGAAHLAANGDLASVVLFSSFLAYAAVDWLLQPPAGATAGAGAAPRVTQDVVAVLAGGLAYALVLYFHEALFGVAVLV